MKKATYILVLALFSLAGLHLQAQTTWDFTTISSADETLLSNDKTGNWTIDSSSRWCYINTLTNQALTASGTELAFAKGLLFSCNANSSGNIRLGQNRLWVGGSSCPITIPGLKKGQTVTISYKTSSKEEARGITPSNLSGTSGFEKSLSQQEGKGTVSSDGDVVLTPTGGLYIYSLAVSEVPNDNLVIVPGEEATLYQDVVTGDVARNSKVNQMTVELLNGNINYYNTGDLSGIDTDNDKATVSISLKNGGTDIYYGSVRNISFTKKVSQGESGDITNNGVIITDAKGWLESAFVEWEPYANATSYVVYIKGGQFANWTKLDNMLVRNYGLYGRADMVGLKASTDYAFKVVPVVSDNEEDTKASFAENLNVRNYSREGFAHKTWSKGVGAYNDDGTLKSNAKVLYITKNTAKTVKCTVITSENGATTECTGLQTIIDAYQKGCDTTPLAIRIIGTVSLSDLDKTSSSEEGLQIKGRNADSELNFTIEGIGEDATLRGFGFLVRNSKSVEFRNFAIIRCMDDGISLDTDNSNIWIHHIDAFYGKRGSGDHVKGDGAIDVKSDSKYVTVSYCHYWDTGKTNMFGMKSESGPNYISYDHNWFDHSDSRHPRVRTMSVHVWNNYFDNVAKFGVGAATGASVFVENNYFLKTKKPILISEQGTDAQGSGTFSGEEGGMIKAFGNYFDRSATNFRYYTQNNPASTGYDAYETSSRDEQVPSSEKTQSGGYTYNNFDTNASLMYSYTVQPASEVPNTVTGYYGAGRLNHGDISYTFSDNVGNDDADSAYDEALAALLDGYQSSLVGIFGGETISGGEQGGEGGEGGVGGEGGEGGVTITTDVECTFDKDGNPSNSLFTVEGNGSNSKGTATVNGVTYSTCLKIETDTSIKFTTTKEMTMTLVFGDDDTKFTIKVDGEKKTGANHQLTMTLASGEHELTKADSTNLFYIGLKALE